MFNHCVIMAAGKGERMKPLTEYIPKPLVNVEGMPLIRHTFTSFHLARWFPNIHVTVGHLSHLMYDELGLCVSSFINTTGRGNEWFLFNSLIQYIDEPIIVCAADLIFSINWNDLYKECSERNEGWIGGIVTVPDTLNSQGDFVKVEDGKVKSIGHAFRQDLRASGIQIINPARLNRFFMNKAKPKSFYEVWDALIEDNALINFETQPTSWRAIDKLDQI